MTNMINAGSTPYIGTIKQRVFTLTPASPVLCGEVHSTAIPAQHRAAVAHIGDDNLVTSHQRHGCC
jgi:hypothetical protein